MHGLKRGGGLFIFYFCIQKERGAKYRNYSTSIPSSPFPNMLQEMGQLQGLKHGLQCLCIACHIPGNME